MLASVEGEHIYKRIVDTLVAHGMDRMLDGGVVVGLSGGADSVLLLSALYEFRRRSAKNMSIVAVHINHMIRGEEAERDEHFSRELAASLGLECICVKRDAPALASERSIGIEEAAREVRYSVFREILQGRDDLSCVALAHNSTDNLETVIINMMRGCGIGGMCGIPPVRGEIIRPLMSLGSEEIRSLLDEHGIGYVIDSTNLSDDYTRNYIRHNVTPSLRRISSDPERMAERMCENMRDAYSLVSDIADRIVEGISDLSRFEVTHLRGLPPSVLAAVITRIVKSECGTIPTEKHIRLVGDAVKSDEFSVSLCGEYDFAAERGICFFRKKIKTERNGEFFELKEGKNNIDGYALDVFVGKAPDKSSLNIYNFSIEHSFRSDIIDGGLFIRFRSDGDSYRYGSHTRRLKKVFNDRGIPPFMRDSIPMLCDGHGILWVPGLPTRDGSTGDVRVTFCFRRPTSFEREVFVARDMTKIEKQKGLDNTL